MLVNVDSKAFRFAVDAARKAVDNRQYVECLRGVRIVASHADGVTVTGTNLDEWCSAEVDGADVQAAGSVLVSSARELSAIVKELGSGTITLSTSSVTDGLQITAAGSVTTVATLPLEDYPTDPIVGDSVGTVTLPAADMLTMVSTVVRFASKDMTRPVLTAACLEADGSRLTASATDSYRLGFDWFANPGSFTGPVLVRAAALSIVGRYAKGSDGVTMTADSDRITMTVGNIVVTSRLVQGQYPDVQRLLPDSFEGTFTVDRKAAAAAAVRASKADGAKTNPLRMIVTADSLELVMSVQDGVTSTATLAASDSRQYSRDGVDPVTIGCNASFLADALAASVSPSVTVDYINPLRPFVIRNGKPDSGVLQMPIRLAG